MDKQNKLTLILKVEKEIYHSYQKLNPDSLETFKQQKEDLLTLTELEKRLCKQLIPIDESIQELKSFLSQSFYFLKSSMISEAIWSQEERMPYLRLWNYLKELDITSHNRKPKKKKMLHYLLTQETVAVMINTFFDALQRPIFIPEKEAFMKTIYQFRYLYPQFENLWLKDCIDYFQPELFQSEYHIPENYNISDEYFSFQVDQHYVVFAETILDKLIESLKTNTSQNIVGCLACSCCIEAMTSSSQSQFYYDKRKELDILLGRSSSIETEEEPFRTQKSLFYAILADFIDKYDKNIETGDQKELCKEESTNKNMEKFLKPQN